jgi:hypothetical protein
VSRGTFDRGGTRGVRGCTPSPLTQVFLSERTIKRGEGEKRLKKNNVKFTQGKKYNLMLNSSSISLCRLIVLWRKKSQNNYWKMTEFLSMWNLISLYFHYCFKDRLSLPNLGQKNCNSFPNNWFFKLIFYSTSFYHLKCKKLSKRKAENKSNCILFRLKLSKLIIIRSKKGKRLSISTY